MFNIDGLTNKQFRYKKTNYSQHSIGLVAGCKTKHRILSTNCIMSYRISQAEFPVTEHGAMEAHKIQHFTLNSFIYYYTQWYNHLNTFLNTIGIFIKDHNGQNL